MSICLEFFVESLIDCEPPVVDYAEMMQLDAVRFVVGYSSEHLAAPVLHLSVYIVVELLLLLRVLLVSFIAFLQARVR